MMQPKIDSGLSIGIEPQLPARCVDMPSPSTTMRLVVGSHNMDGRPWDASRLATWLHPTGALDAADDDALDNFARSLAGYCVATYVLGIGDRHNDNIMLTRDGRYFHIDFGHFLGNFKKKFGVKRESAPFVLTPHMETVLGGRGAGARYRKFEELCCKAFLVLRRHRDHIMVLLMLMVDCGIPELAKIEDVTWVHGSLMFDEPDDDAAVSGVMALIDASLNNKRTRTMHAIHSLVHTT